MNPTPNSRFGMTVACPRCAATPNRPCISNTGRELRVTHDSRMRVELAADPVRRWIAQRMEWVTGS